MHAADHQNRTLPVWAEWLLGVWIFGAAFFYFVRIASLVYRAHEAAIAALFS
jgi:hypothetical protein